VSPVADLLVDWLRRPRFEVIPFDGAEDDALRRVPARLTSPSASDQGIGPTLMLCAAVAPGHRAVLHRAARLVADRTQLRTCSS
jgi:hypothetical protein